MKESGPEKKESKLVKEVKEISLFLSFIVIGSIYVATCGAIMRVIDLPETKIGISVTMKPSKKGEPPTVIIKVTRQCIDRIVHAAPAPFAKTTYKDCE
ncbi:hypothetical protein ACFL3T_00400 [Patescibacteria group bacterium]